MFIAIPISTEGVLVAAYSYIPELFKEGADNKVPELIAYILQTSEFDRSFLNTLTFLPEGLRDTVMKLPVYIRQVTPQMVRQAMSVLPYDKVKGVIDAMQPYMVQQVLPNVSVMIPEKILSGTAELTIFMDQFLICSLYFFLTYEPKRLKAGGKLIFRLFAMLPLQYIILSVVMMGLVRCGNLKLPIPVLGAPAHGRPCAYAVLLCIVVYEMYRTVKHREEGLSGRELVDFLETPREKFNFSVFIALAVALISMPEGLCQGSTTMINWNIGKEGTHIGSAIPFLYLIGMDKKPKHRWPDRIMFLYKSSTLWWWVCCWRISSRPEWNSSRVFNQKSESHKY